MKNRTHAGHFLGGGRVEFDHSAVGDCRFDRNGIQHPGKVEIGGVLRHATHLHRPVDARLAFADDGHLCAFWHNKRLVPR